MTNNGRQLDQLPDVLTVKEAAALLRVNHKLVYESIRRGDLPAVKLGKRIVIPKQALARLLAEGNAHVRNER